MDESTSEVHQAICSFADCTHPRYCRGYCKAHYGQLQRHGVVGPLIGQGRHGHHRRGEQCYQWNHGRLITSHGYVLARVPDGHHLQQAHGYAYEHQLVAEQAIGRRLTSSESVHHRDGNTANNDPDNIVVMGRGEHSRLHNTKYPQHATCVICGAPKVRNPSEHCRSCGRRMGARKRSALRWGTKSATSAPPAPVRDTLALTF